MAKANSVGSCPSNPRHHIPKSGAVVGGDRLTWRRVGSNLALFRGASKKPVLHVVPDLIWPGMFRVSGPGSLSDFCNLTRAKDAGLAIALRDLNPEVQEKPSDGTHVRGRRVGLGVVPSDLPGIPTASKGLSLGSRR
jgi:hypothetical protein